MKKSPTIVVCGAGTMGSGIALVCAKAGYATIQYDVSEDMLQKSQKSMQTQLDKWVSKNALTPDQAAAIGGRLVFTQQIADCRADMAIEAIVEQPEAKVQLFQALLAQNPSGMVLASNTSSLSVHQLAAALPAGTVFWGLHFFNPAPLMPLVEVIPGPGMAVAAQQEMMDWVRTLGKTPVLCQDAPGFIVNRVARPYYLTALRLVENQKASPEQIDALLTAAGFKMGPFALMDLIGLDINLAVSQQVWQALGQPERLKPSSLQAQKVTAGQLGRKTGAGFYVYEKP